MECNFTHSHYLQVLKKAKKEYSIGPVKDFKKIKKNKKHIILRHDVDVSLDIAYDLAKKEANLGLFSTYFILLHSPYYNALDENSFEKIQKISKLGHEIGLHYDVSFLKKYGGGVLKNLKDEMNILSKIIGTEVISIAQHDPTYSSKLKTNERDIFLDVKNKDLNKNLIYLSDSVQNWRSGCMCQYIGKVDGIHILTHPIWWSETGFNKKQILDNFVSKKNKALTNRIAISKIFYKKYLSDIKKGI